MDEYIVPDEIEFITEDEMVDECVFIEYDECEYPDFNVDLYLNNNAGV